MHSGHAAGSLHSSLLVAEMVPACPHGLPALCLAPPPCPLAGKTIVAIASGANMDFDRLRFVSERSDSTETLLAVRIGEKVGRQPAIPPTDPPTHPPSPLPVRPSLLGKRGQLSDRGTLVVPADDSLVAFASCTRSSSRAT